MWWRTGVGIHLHGDGSPGGFGRLQIGHEASFPFLALLLRLAQLFPTFPAHCWTSWNHAAVLFLCNNFLSASLLALDSSVSSAIVSLHRMPLFESGSAVSCISIKTCSDLGTVVLSSADGLAVLLCCSCLQSLACMPVRIQL